MSKPATYATNPSEKQKRLSKDEFGFSLCLLSVVATVFRFQHFLEPSTELIGGSTKKLNSSLLRPKQTNHGILRGSAMIGATVTGIVLKAGELQDFNDYINAGGVVYG